MRFLRLLPLYIYMTQASLGIANLIVMAMQEKGISIDDARSRINLLDSRGLIVKDRPKGGITGHKVSTRISFHCNKISIHSLNLLPPSIGRCSYKCSYDSNHPETDSPIYAVWRSKFHESSSMRKNGSKKLWNTLRIYIKTK